jgi:undecaprenyl-diphosphatase
VEVAGRRVTITEPARTAWERSPGDVLRVIVSALASLLAFGMFEFARNTAVGLEEDVAEALRAVPQFVVLTVFALFSLALLVTPLVVLMMVIRRRNWRLLGLYFLTTTTATVTFTLLEGFITSRVPAPPNPLTVLPEAASVDLWSFPFFASLAAALVVNGPWISRRWRRLAWSLLLASVPLRILAGVDVPSGILFAIAGGWFLGSIIVLVFGSPQRNPSGLEVVEGLDDAGIHLVEIQRAGVDARGSTPYFATDVAGRPYFVKVLGIDERNADLMFRIYRWIRLDNVGDERPFSSLRRTVEHEALVSVMAERASVTTPSLVSAAELADGSMVLVYERVAGRSLDKVDQAEITPDVLRGVWRQVRVLHEHRIAHRDLRRANVFLDDDGQPLLIDFGFGEVSASRLLLNQDVAQLVVSTAVDVGAERAVADAVAVMGPDVVAAAAPRMQPIALAGATQSALKKRKHLLAAIHSEVLQQTDLPDIELAKLERVKPRTLVMAALLFLATWFLIPQLTEVPRLLTEIKDANWVWAIPAVIFSMLTYLGAAMSLASSVSERIGVAKTTLVTLAGSFVNRVTPAKIGGMALNVRFLQKQGVETSVAAASVGLSQGVGMLVHISLLAVFAVWAGKTINYADLLPSGTVVLAVVAGALVIIGVAIGTPKLRRLFATKVKPQIGKIGANVRDLFRHPVRLLIMVTGSAILTLSYIGALWASIQAFGGGLPIAGIAVVFLAGASIASAAPTPGGIGAVEAALVAGLTALGLASAVAVPAVFLYRLATFWIPVLPGWAGFSVLQRRGDI